MPDAPPILSLQGVNAGYGRQQILRDVSLDVAAGEIHCLLGRNGAGKSTTMRAVMGHIPLMAGKIKVADRVLSDLKPHQVAAAGVGFVPQGRRLFGELTVRQNLEVGLLTRGGSDAILQRQLALFPRLKERLGQRAETLSGGEQQMLATARALCVEPKVLLLDEPTEGLQPSMIDLIRQVIVQMRGEGVGILLVEQRVDAVLAVADRVTVIENGRIRATYPASELRQNHKLLEQFIGV